MRARTLAVVAAIGLTAPPLAAQGEGGSRGAYEDDSEEVTEAAGGGADAESRGLDGGAEGAPDGEAPDGSPEEAPTSPAQAPPAQAPPAQAPPAQPPSPSPDPAPLRSPIKRLRGAVVVARRAAARAAAKALARVVYKDERLRPAMTEGTAQVLVGGSPAAGNTEQAQVAAVLKALDAVDDEDVRRRLLVSLADDLSAQLVVEVAMDEDGQPRARVLRLPDERFLSVTLTSTKAGQPPAWKWDDAIGILRGLVVGPPPGPRIAPSPQPAPQPVDPGDDGESDWDLLKSPWFWGGLGVVVTVGVTVLILSQTALNEPDVVMLEGRVAP